MTYIVLEDLTLGSADHVEGVEGDHGIFAKLVELSWALREAFRRGSLFRVSIELELSRFVGVVGNVRRHDEVKKSTIGQNVGGAFAREMWEAVESRNLYNRSWEIVANRSIRDSL